MYIALTLTGQDEAFQQPSCACLATTAAPQAKTDVFLAVQSQQVPARLLVNLARHGDTMLSAAHCESQRSQTWHIRQLGLYM